jgi:sulfotransferase
MKEMIKEIIREEMIRAQEKTYYFMAGLPRSGSTLLSSILNQNPEIYSGPSSPVLNTMIVLEEYISNDEFFNAYPKPDQAGKIITNIIQHFYSDIEKPIIVDKNRAWLNKLHYIEGYFGIKPKILVPVRSMDEILASFISMHRRNEIQVNGKLNFIDEMLVKNNMPLTDENRCAILSNEGIVGSSYQAIRQALMQGHQNSMLFIEYDDLVNNPNETMKNIYEFLEINFYQHDFKDLTNTNQEKDVEIYGFKDMHKVRSNLEKTSTDPKEILPESVIEMCKDAEFWRNLDINIVKETLEDVVTLTDNTELNDERLIGGSTDE